MLDEVDEVVDEYVTEQPVMYQDEPERIDMLQLNDIADEAEEVVQATFILEVEDELDEQVLLAVGYE